MSFRDFLNKHPSIMTGSLVAMVVGAGWYGFSQMKSITAGPDDTAYYSDDDGKTYFGGNPMKFFPFSSGGGKSVRAYVFECKGERFVGYLSRYTAAAAASIDKFRADREAGRTPTNAGEMTQAMSGGQEFKKPGDTKWVSQSQMAELAKIQGVKCPDGSSAVQVGQ